jgi:hypothetical protein
MDTPKPMQHDEPPALRYLEPEQVRAFRTADGRVRATIAEERSVIAPRFLRVHPITDPDRYISIREADPGGKEAGLLRNWRRLDGESRTIVQAELDRRYLHPAVRRILSAQQFWGFAVCVFETDRGVREVTLRDARDSAVYIGAARVLVTDAEGNRYDFPDVNALDPASRARLSQIL